MGCCCGSGIEKKIPPDWLAQFKALQLSRSELTKFFNTYKRIDRDKKGSIELQELLDFLDVENTSFTNRAFSVFDSNGSGKIDFREFVLSLWNYCTLTKATLDIFTFDLYDEDSSGELGMKEVLQMVEDLYGKKFKSNANAKQVVSDLRKLEMDGPFTLQRFSEFAKSHQQLLYPAFQIQMKMQDKIMGPSFWEKCTTRRVEWSKGRFITMAQMMELHMNPELYQRLAAANSFQSSRWGNKKKNQNNGSVGPSLAFSNTGTRHERSAAQSHHGGPPPGPPPSKNNKKKVVIHSVEDHHGSSYHDVHSHENYENADHEVHGHNSYHSNHSNGSHHKYASSNHNEHHYQQTNYYDTGDDIPQDQYYDADYVDNQYGQQEYNELEHHSYGHPGHKGQNTHQAHGRKNNKVVVVTEDYDE